MAVQSLVFVGTAGWNIPRGSARRFPADGTHLQRYAQRLTCTEINSSFYRPHSHTTYRRWADSTPDDFRFAVKIPRAITHDARLARSEAALEQFLHDTDGLGSKRGPLLVQLPPSLAYDARLVGRFFSVLRRRYDGPVVCEPRHVSWAGLDAERMLSRYRVSRVAADPPLAPAFAHPAGWPGLVYIRLHGSPRTYWSRYTLEYLDALAASLRTATTTAWCVFDNTAAGAAAENACELFDMVGHAEALPSLSARQ